MTDEAILRKAHDEKRILVTNDKDFGEKIFRERLPHHGVILFRLDDERSASKIKVLEKLLVNHAERVAGKFVVLTENRVRFVES
jgi:predicted nuclease of predicted toxin-antitoxin system